MTEYIYYYEPAGYTPGCAFRSFDTALARLKDDENIDTISDYIKELDEYDLWHDIDLENEVFHVDDGGPSITKIELI